MSDVDVDKASSPDSDTELLDAHAAAHTKELPKNTQLYYFVAAVTALLHTGLFFAVKDVSVFSVQAVLALSVSLACAIYFMKEAYDANYETTLLKNSSAAPATTQKRRFGRNRGEKKRDELKAREKEKKDLKELTQETDSLRHMTALSYSLLMCNIIFYVVVLFCNYYLLRTWDSLLNYTITLCGASGIVYWFSDEDKKAYEAKLLKERKGK